MNMMPIFLIRDMKTSLDFYTRILDFKAVNEQAHANWPVVAIHHGNAFLLLTSIEGDQKPGVCTNVAVTNVDEIYERYLKRGLDTSIKKDSPVHQRPIDQTWGMREFYITDPDENTLRFVQL